MVVRWTFYDPATSVTATFAINPNVGGTPGRKKTFTYQNTAAPGGRTLMFQGREEVQTVEFSGTLWEQAELDMFTTWFEKANQIRLTDDLGRQYWIVVTDFVPQRVRAAQSPWKHTYQVKAVVVDYP